MSPADSPGVGSFTDMRVLWLLLGAMGTALALVGIVLPLLPTVPFVLLASFAFAKSSRRFHEWLHQHPQLGAALVQWELEGAISKPARRAALGSLIAAIAASAALGVSERVLVIQVLVAAAVIAFIFTRPLPRKADGSTDAV